jgi:hypothetical protein
MKPPLIILSLFLAIVTCVLAISSPADAQASKPSDAYKQFLARLYWAKQLKDFTFCMQESTRTHMESLTGQEARDVFLRYKRSYVAKFKVIKEEVVEDRAFIEGEGIAVESGQRVKAHVRAQMVREGGAWKVMFTNWSGTIYGR